MSSLPQSIIAVCLSFVLVMNNDNTKNTSVIAIFYWFIFYNVCWISHYAIKENHYQNI